MKGKEEERKEWGEGEKRGKKRKKRKLFHVKQLGKMKELEGIETIWKRREGEGERKGERRLNLSLFNFFS